LRKDCLSNPGCSKEEGDQCPGTKDLFYIEECSEEHISWAAGETLGMDELSVDATNTLIDKFKFYCPYIFFKLSLWERDFLENSVLSHTISSTVNKKGLVSAISGGALGVPDNNLPLPYSVSVVSETSVPMVSSLVDLNSLAIPSLYLSVSDPPLVESSVSVVVEYLVPTLRENFGLVPLQNFWGSTIYVNPRYNSSGVFITDRPDPSSKMARSRGLASEVSPIKTRSA